VEGTLDIEQSTDFPFSLTKSIASLRDLNKRSGTFSKEFLIPATKENNKLLQYLYSSNQRPVKNMKDKKTALVMVDDIIVERGYIKISKVITSPTGRSYSVLFFGDNTEWMTLLNNTTLDELPFNNNTQIFSDTNVQNSWISAYSSEPDQSGDINHFDHIYPWISYGTYTLVDTVSVEDLRPAIRYKAIVERALQKVGFTLDSEFMSTTFFPRFIFPFIGDKFHHPDPVLIDKLFLASPLVQQTIQGTLGQLPPSQSEVGDLLLFPDDSTGDNFNNGGHYDGSTNLYTIPIRGKYRFRFTLHIESETGSGAIFPVLYVGTQFTTLNASIVTPTPDQALDNEPLIIDLGYFLFEVGDVVRFQFLYQGVPGQQITFKTTSTFQLLDMSDEILRGNAYDFSDVLAETNVLALFGDISKLFNLYWRTDNKVKKVFVEDRDTFFNPISDAVDWSDKLSLSNDWELRFLGKHKKELLFRYITDENDAYVIQRNLDKEFGQNEYCSYRHVFPDRFPKGQTKIETEVIAATYGAQDKLATDVANTLRPITARMWDEANIGGDAPEPSYAFNPRILNFVNAVQFLPDGQQLTWRYEGVDRNVIPSAMAVPFLGNPFGLSLSFAQEDGLVDNHYKRTLGVIEDGVELVAWFNLTTTDYQSFNMQNLVYLDYPEELNGYWIVDTIHDYSPLGGLTKVTLLKFHNADSKGNQVTIDTDWGGDIGPTGTTGDLPNLPAGDPIGFGGTKVPTTNNQEAPERRSVVVNNGTGNQAAKNSGSFAGGQGCKAFEENQTMLGRFPKTNDDIFAVGVGVNDRDRVSGIRSDKDGNVTFYGGGVYILDSDGKRVQVTIQSGGKERPIHLE